ncbi:MAG TPA: gluconokinase [Nocardioidaceae bacterium]|jgi:gluconokinase|nr:gluconokinase [Nocardioidaceae bacterium]
MPGSRRKPMHIVVMGVSATGKTSVGELLAEELGCEFVEGDSLHPRRNIEKMEAGTPLTDEDRWPWLQAIADLVAVRDHEGTSTVVTCSALKRKYRDILRDAAPTFFVHLDAPFQVLEARMQQRTKHFMPTSLLRSQFDTLEPLDEDESGAVVDVSPPIDEVVEEAVNAVRTHYLD